MSIAAVALLAVGQLASANAPLEQCRKLDKEFDTKAMITPCQAAADDGTQAVADRVEALRLLGFAHIVNGDDALAEPAFLKMMVLSPKADLPADAGQRAKEAFGRVKARFLVDGQIKAAFIAPARETVAPVQIQLDVEDKLGRIVAARVRAQASDGGSAEERLVRAELGPGQVRFSGAVPEPTAPAEAQPAARTIAYEVSFEGWDGDVVPAEAPVTGELVREGAPLGGDVEIPWLWIGVGTAAVVGVAAITTGVVAWCFIGGPCREQDAWVRVQVKDGAP